uniref:COesterase domain-containing protein n=1 Tax=Angiostrongylus cantonensis TaxID=6313 RepID=A0A0K0D0D5_ANGCA
MTKKQPRWVFRRWSNELRRIRRITKFNSAAKAKHDGTLLSLMYAMGVANDQMIPYASSFIMEIYEHGKDYEVEVSDFICGCAMHSTPLIIVGGD